MSDVIPDRIVLLLDLSDQFQRFSGEQHHDIFYRFRTLTECLNLIRLKTFSRVDFFVPATIDIPSFHQIPYVHVHPDVNQLPITVCEDRIRQQIQSCCHELGFDHISIGTTESNEQTRQMINQAAQLATDRARIRRGRPPREVVRNISPLPPFV
jgi:hypothetical protein